MQMKDKNIEEEHLSFRIKRFFRKVKRRTKKYFKIFKEKFLNIYGPNFIWIAMPFILMDVFIFIFASNINYHKYLFISPMLFSLAWILLFIGLCVSFKKWINRIIYIILNLLFMLLYVVQGVYYSLMKDFFDFTLVESASEGSPYMWDAIKGCNKLVYLGLFIVIIFFIIGFKKLPKNRKNDYKKAGIVLLIFLVLHIICPLTYGRANNKLTWSSWRNPKNVYNSFNDSNKSIKISGFYEYTFRNFYVTFIKSSTKANKEDMEFLENAYTEELSTKNSYTGKFKGKNLILVQLEGTDNWLITKNDTPTLYNMMTHGINFNKHYSFYNGGGSTFNSEFAVNTGFVTPLSYNKNAYTFNKNNFPNTLAKTFKNDGYVVNAFHMNTGEYYSRTPNYKNWGYNNYYGLIDLYEYSDKSYYLDRELILNEEYSDLMFPSDTPFVDYIIAYSGHTPFNNTKGGVCKLLYELDNEGIEEDEVVQMSEEECARRQAKETDYMMQLLIKKLTDKGILDNTVIVVYTDHYLYSLVDKTILEKYKDTNGSLINHTPCFIWSSKIKKATVNKVTSQLNILPTVLNLYGYQYNVNNYIGKDALDSKYKGIVFFSDYSWYDGNVYVENGEVANGKKVKPDYLDEMNEYVNYMAKKNDLTLKYNYFKDIKK